MNERVTIDVAKLRSLARYQNDAVITAKEITELLDAYEERDSCEGTAVKTREEIENEYVEAVRRDYKIYLDAYDAHGRKRAAALAELDNPTARLIAAFKEHMNCRECWPLCISCHKTLRDAIDYAEQRRAQWL